MLNFNYFNLFTLGASFLYTATYLIIVDVFN